MKIAIFLMAMMGAISQAQAEIITAYQCESRCVAVDFERNLFQVLNVTASAYQLTEQDAWLDLNSQCESMRYQLGWSGKATSMLLVKNEVFEVESDRAANTDQAESSSSYSSTDASAYSSVDVYRGKTKIKSNPFRTKIETGPSVSHATSSSTLNTSSSSQYAYEFHFYERNVLKVKLDMETKKHSCKASQVDEYDVLPVYNGSGKVGG